MLTKNTAVSRVAICMAAPFLLLVAASMAAPVPDMTDIESRLLSGLRASDYYVVSYVAKQSLKAATS